MKCASCGSEIEGTPNRCPQCGELAQGGSLPVEAALDEATTAEAEAPQGDDAMQAEGASREDRALLLDDAEGADGAEQPELASEDGEASAAEHEESTSVSGEPLKSDPSAAASGGGIAAKLKGGSRKALIAIGAVIAVLFLVGIASCVSTPQPFECDREVTVDTVTFSYPHDWSTSEKDSEGEEVVYLYPPVSGIVMIQGTYEPFGKLDASRFEEFITGANMKRSSSAESMSVGGFPAYTAEVSWENEGESYKGYLLVMAMERSYVTCMAMIGDGQDAKYMATMNAIVASARMSDAQIEYEVTFESDGNVVSQESVVNEAGGAVVVPPADLKKEGFVLDGWKAKAEGEGVNLKLVDGKYVIFKAEGPVILEAVWAPVFTVTFTDGMGNVLKTQQVKQGGGAVAPSQPTREGYSFNGWSGTYANVSEDQTVEATWMKIPTMSEANALKRAKSYLSHSSFSYESLIDQLEFEQFSYEDAVYAVDNCGADWFEQAAKKAKSYMKHSSFSRGRLIDQLEFEGFTPDQAEYGADAVGL